MTGLSGLAPWQWAALGTVLAALGTWRNWALCRSLGIGSLATALAAWGLDVTDPVFQLVLFVVLAGLAAIGGRKMDTVATAFEETRRTHIGPVGHSGTVAEAIRNGHGTVRVGGENWPATGPDLPSGTPVRIVGRDDESLKVAPLPPKS